MIAPDSPLTYADRLISSRMASAVRDARLRVRLRSLQAQLFSTNHSPQTQATTLRDLLCCLPQVVAPTALSYDNLFRVLIVQFIDAQGFDLRSIEKTCIHIAHPDGQRVIPFDTFNMFYRDHLEQSRIEPLRARTLASV